MGLEGRLGEASISEQEEDGSGLVMVGRRGNTVKGRSG